MEVSPFICASPKEVKLLTCAKLFTTIVSTVVVPSPVIVVKLAVVALIPFNVKLPPKLRLPPILIFELIFKSPTMSSVELGLFLPIPIFPSLPT